MKLFDQVKDVVTGATVFGEPYVKNGVTVIPASRVMGGGGGGQAADEEAGGGGVGLDARPVGVLVIKGDDVRWVPAFDLSRVIFSRPARGDHRDPELAVGRSRAGPGEATLSVHHLGDTPRRTAHAISARALTSVGI